MAQTFRAILRGDRLEWQGPAPDHADEVLVAVTLEETLPPQSQTEEPMSALFAELARRGTFSDIADPVAWQREQRCDRPLPERE